MNTANGSHPERFQYGYDRNGNVLYQANLVNTSQSELYRSNSAASGDSNSAYDPLGRLAAFSRGTLSSSGHNGSQLDTVSSPSHAQSYGLDALGNFATVTTDGSTATRDLILPSTTKLYSTGYLQRPRIWTVLLIATLSLPN